VCECVRIRTRVCAALVDCINGLVFDTFADNDRIPNVIWKRKRTHAHICSLVIFSDIYIGYSLFARTIA